MDLGWQGGMLQPINSDLAVSHSFQLELKENCKGQRIQKEIAQPESHMASIQFKTNVALGREVYRH